MLSESIVIILSYTVSKFVHFVKHSVLVIREVMTFIFTNVAT